MPKPSSLSLALRAKGGKEHIGSPLSPRSPGSPSAVYGGDADTATPTAALSDVPESPASPKPRKDSKSIFSNFGASRSSSRIMSTENQQLPKQSGPTSLYANGGSNGSEPHVDGPALTPHSEDHRSGSIASEQPPNSSADRVMEATEQAQEDDNGSKHAAKAKKQDMLSRSKSIKIEDNSTNRAKLAANPPKTSPEASASWNAHGDGAPLKTAPLEKGQSWRQNISFAKLRTHSADRHDASQHAHRDDEAFLRRDKAEQSSLASGSYNESRGAALMSNLGSGARKVGEKMETARKGIFGKLGRSSSNHEKESQGPKEPYQFKIIHLGLVEQTRLTRISSRLEDSKDKTEFWMPALPWRCIDYLNMKGCEEEGLYRVPGAAHTVKDYEQKFDQDRDIDLIGDEDLNDPNVIGSLFKNWLRQLPDEIFPKSVQAKIQQECQGAKTTPQMLKDELSKLPPFNYYLLFAITCHISLLHSCSEFNKMNYNNLCICFQPAIKIDAFCFQFLILDWRNCWQGCWTEKEYLTEELRLLTSPDRERTPTQDSERAKSTQASKYLGDNIKPSSSRNNSADRTGKYSISSRAISADRNPGSGRGTPTPPTTAIYSPEKPSSSKPGGASERESSTDRAISSSASREAFNHRTPKRAPAAVKTEPLPAGEDNGATPTQAQHARGGSENQFRLDLTNPPSSPFSIKF